MPARFLTAQWRDLAVLNFVCPQDLLKPHLPAGCVLDDWQGRHYVSLVAFLFLNTKVFGMPIPFHRHFEEVNLRFYVKRFVEGQWRRGVVFIREIVPRFLIAWTARAFYNENYLACPMRHQHHQQDAQQTWHYEWHFKNSRNFVNLATQAQPRSLIPASEEEFILEHYYGYTRQKNGSTLEYEVRHPRWQVFDVHSCDWFCDASPLYGPAFASVLAQPPASVLGALGSPIEVYRGVPLS